MPPTTVRFYFDYVSPNAYVAWTQLPAVADRYGAAIEPCPVLFAGLLDAHGRLGPAEVEDVADSAGLAGASLVARAQEAEGKVRLRGQTDDAIARGVFGVPTMLVGDEL